MKYLLPLVWVTAQSLLVDALAATPLPEPETTATPEVEIAPMSDPAIMGAVCLGLAAATVATIYTIGPTRIQAPGFFPSTTLNTALVIPILGTFGAVSCVLGAMATPGVRWMIEQANPIGDQLQVLTERRQDTAGEAVRPPRSIRPMTVVELQSMGCVVGALAGFVASMVTLPTEIAMLASGITVIAPSVSVLGLRLLTTVGAAGCGIGSLIAIPVMALIDANTDDDY